MRYSYEVTIAVPESWDEDNIEFHRNSSSWCAGNSLGDIERIDEGPHDGCLCRLFEAEYLRDADEEDDKAYGLTTLGGD